MFLELLWGRKMMVYEMEIKGMDKLKLYGFNNLTKALSFNMYDICYANKSEYSKGYIEYIDEQYNADRLTSILVEVSNIIGANVLNIAKQDYEPQGASVAILISEEKIVCHDSFEDHSQNETPGPLPDTILAHLDKSHITVHTYPETHPDEGISTFRADIDVSTCGRISPLKALNFLIRSFDPDIVTIDYRVRGFTRDVGGNKLFIDHKINSIQNYIPGEIREKYQMIDVNVYQENIFHTKMLLREFDLDNYLFGTSKTDFSLTKKRKVKMRLKKEMSEIFYGRNVPRV
jgi:S-adenosylmethionine decarboxylase